MNVYTHACNSYFPESSAVEHFSSSFCSKAVLIISSHIFTSSSLLGPSFANIPIFPPNITTMKKITSSKTNFTLPSAILCYHTLKELSILTFFNFVSPNNSLLLTMLYK